MDRNGSRNTRNRRSNRRSLETETQNRTQISALPESLRMNERQPSGGISGSNSSRISITRIHRLIRVCRFVGNGRFLRTQVE
ncbi:hypothetical protein M5D96_003391 [Drosophila gunungcola]|uniref:Uncharacterized protein n=1 Tax=Drosophila gunungcola TaxID=103775 RepID=A0A9P9YS69_9MUSC|nr:hypothetical protein M5D96_003391 [Drosophila gunungcola]